MQIPVDQIDTPWRDLFPPDNENIEQIAEDLRAFGTINTPLHAHPKDDGRYELLTGHDRLEAATRAGLTEVPVSTRMIPDEDERFAYAIRDNTMRKAVDKRTVARAVWERYPDKTIQQIADIAGVSKGTAENARNDLIQSGDIDVSKVGNARTDTLGRQQPRLKPRPTPTPASPPASGPAPAETAAPAPIVDEVDPFEDLAEPTTPMPPTAAAPACAECEALRSRLDEEREWGRKILDALGAKERDQALERISALKRPSADKSRPTRKKPTPQRSTKPVVMIKDGEAIQEYEKRRRKAESDAMPSAMF